MFPISPVIQGCKPTRPAASSGGECRTVSERRSMTFQLRWCPAAGGMTRLVRQPVHAVPLSIRRDEVADVPRPASTHAGSCLDGSYARAMVPPVAVALGRTSEKEGLWMTSAKPAADRRGVAAIQLRRVDRQFEPLLGAALGADPARHGRRRGKGRRRGTRRVRVARLARPHRHSPRRPAAPVCRSGGGARRRSRADRDHGQRQADRRDVGPTPLPAAVVPLLRRLGGQD